MQVEIGNALVPAIRGFLDYFTQAIRAVGDFIQKNQQLIVGVSIKQVRRTGDVPNRQWLLHRLDPIKPWVLLGEDNHVKNLMCERYAYEFEVDRGSSNIRHRLMLVGDKKIDPSLQ